MAHLLSPVTMYTTRPSAFITRIASAASARQAWSWLRRAVNNFQQAGRTSRDHKLPAQVLLTLFNCVCQGKNCYHIRLLSQQNGRLGPVFHVLHNVKRIVRNSAAVLQGSKKRSARLPRCCTYKP